jgi:hypothetical protein
MEKSGCHPGSKHVHASELSSRDEKKAGSSAMPAFLKFALAGAAKPGFPAAVKKALSEQVKS